MKRFLALSVAFFMVTCLLPSGSEATPADWGTLKGNVVGTDGGPLIGVFVQATNVTTETTYEGLTNDVGDYSIDMPAGIYNVTATLANHTANRTLGPMVISNLTTGLYNFTMVETLNIVSGYITDGQQPIYGVTVTLSNAYFNYTALSMQPLGRFNLTGVKPGTYVAYAEKRGYNRASYITPLTVDRGDSIEANFTMEKQPALVSGKVYGEGSRTLEGVKITLTPTDGSAARVMLSDQYGNYTITDVPVGDYQLAFEKSDYKGQQQDISFSPYENKRIDVTLIKVQKNSTALLFGYDLTHSMMLVGFGVGMVAVLLGIFICIRVQKRPELLANIKTDEEKKDEP